ncbi:hypothetical protein [Methylobacterium sp. A54F]
MLPNPRRPGIRLLCAAGLGLAGCGAVLAQSSLDDPDLTLGTKRSSHLLALADRLLGPSDHRIAALRAGRAGAVCGTVDSRNRMGAYTGPRGFVADLKAGFLGRLPEGPELRNPASAADYRAMERARDLYAANCAE